MHKDQLRKKMIEKYHCDNNDWSKYLLIDAMLVYYDAIHNTHTMLKGALSLLKGYGYKRSKLTRDIDISLINFNVESFVEEIKNSSPMEVEGYTFTFISSKENMVDREYSGRQIKIRFKIGESTQIFNMDLSVEELEEYNDTSKGIYSLERTLIDKISTALYYGIYNTRTKDYEDLKALLRESDLEIIKEMLPKLNAIRKRTVDQVEIFIDTIDAICNRFDSHDIKETLLDLANHSLKALKSK